MDKQTSLSIWNQLNARQQKYLALIYKADQSAEQFEKASWKNGRERRPASVWRWLFYGDINDRPSPLKSRLLNAGLVDQGTGSTLEALESRSLIECDGKVPELYIKATRLCRKVVRVGTDQPVVRATRTPKGMLSKKAWQALILIGKAGKEGFALDGWSQYTQGIHLNVWKHLQQQEPPLTQGYDRLYHTVFGVLFYIRNYEKYRAVYPDIEAPEPKNNVDNIVATVKQRRRQIPHLIRTKRGAKGLDEAAAEIGPPVSPAILSQIEEGQAIQPELLNRIVDWIVR